MITASGWDVGQAGRGRTFRRVNNTCGIYNRETFMHRRRPEFESGRRRKENFWPRISLAIPGHC